MRGDEVSIARHICILLVLVLALSGCQTVDLARADIMQNTGSKQELVLNGRVSLPLPAQYEGIWLNKSSIIVSRPETSIVYRWIDKEEIKFVGSEKSPYDFFKSAFNNPGSAEEKRFLEGLENIVKYSYSADNDLEFYFFDNGGGQQIYILSRSLDFVVEITSKGEARGYIESIIQNSYIR